MNIIKPYFEIETELNEAKIIHSLEWAARTCYRSHERITRESGYKLINAIIKNGHEAMLEHESITIRIGCDRGVTHELVRHRLASFAQESTRYCNYSKGKFNGELTFIKPCFWNIEDINYQMWITFMEQCEKAYLNLIESGATPQEARTVLPNSLATEIVITANLREWRTIMKLRTSKEAHPQMREIMCAILKELRSKLPTIFNDAGVIEDV